MSRLIPALVALVALMAAVPSAAQVGSGRIAYATDGTGIYTVAADGSDPVTLKSDNARVPRWSPDGSKLAFIEYLDGPHGLAVALKVMNADGTGEHVVATAAWWQDIWLSNQPWSADSSRIAWGPAYGDPGADIYTASAAGGDIRRITTDGSPKLPPVWSPTGPQLVYPSSTPDPTAPWMLFLARDDGSAPVPITPGVEPSWSPDGAWIAFSGLYLVHPDGTELHRVAFTAGAGAGEGVWPAWSPDGSKITVMHRVPASCKACPDGQDISLANADGSGEHQLTNHGAQAFDTAPIWSPDGNQILFRRDAYGSTGQLWTMNSDGTCPGLLAAVAATDFPSWQPLPGGQAVGRKTCPAALALDGARTPNGNGSAITIHARISNEGTEPLTNVMLEISAPGRDLGFKLSGGGCTRETEGLFCESLRLGGGESQEVTALAMARRVGLDPESRSIPLRVRLHVTATGATGHLEASDELSFLPSRCVTLDPGTGGRIYGTRFADQICGRRGADTINPGEGNDRVAAGAGPDVINARDGYRDVISCGLGRDLVITDRKDKVARDCERVRRR